MGAYIGIDFGSSYSVCAVKRNGHVEVVPNTLGEQKTPCVLFYTQSNGSSNILAGSPAKAYERGTRRGNVVAGMKQLFGAGVRENGATEAYHTLSEPFEGKMQIANNEAAGHFFTYLKHCAESYLGEKVEKAVLTCPAAFDVDARRDLIAAAERAGLKVVRIISEPAAAALHYGMQKQLGAGQAVAVYDLGGGTFDASVLMFDKDKDVFEVKASGGDLGLGGKLFDEKLMRLVLTRFFAAHADKWAEPDGNVQTQAQAKADEWLACARKGETDEWHGLYHSLRDLCRDAKEMLSAEYEKEVFHQFFHLFDGKNYQHLNVVVTRGDLDTLIRPEIDKTVRILQQVCADAGVPSDGMACILTGGQCRMPLIKEVLQEAGFATVTFEDPQSTVAKGAAEQAHACQTGAAKGNIREVSALNLGVELNGNLMQVLIEQNTPLPATATVALGVAKNMDSASVCIRQGNHPVFADKNKAVALVVFPLLYGRESPDDISKFTMQMTLDENSGLSLVFKEMFTPEGKQPNEWRGSFANGFTKLSEMTE